MSLYSYGANSLRGGGEKPVEIHEELLYNRVGWKKIFFVKDSERFTRFGGSYADIGECVL